MDKGPAYLARIFLAAAAIGVIVLVGHGEYRRTLTALFRGQLDHAPIWSSNLHYYPQVDFGSDKDHADAK